MLEVALKDSGEQNHDAKRQQESDRKSVDTMPPTSHTLMDLVITLAIYLPRQSFSALFTLAAQILPMHSDSQLQNKAYKLLPRLNKTKAGIKALDDQNIEHQALFL